MKKLVLLTLVLLIVSQLYVNATGPILDDEDNQIMVDINALLIVYAKMGSNEGVARCLSDGATIEARKNNGRTALMIAAKYGQERTVQFLLRLGADLHAVDDMRMTALMLAAKNGYPNIVRMLYAAGANINATTSVGWSALMFAVCSQEHAVVGALLEYANVNVYLSDLAGQTVLDFARGVTVKMLRTYIVQHPARRWCCWGRR